MSAENLTAILVLMDDIGRLAWISGFTGSAGSAVITMDKVYRSFSLNSCTLLIAFSSYIKTYR